jgi:hypothetical protein
MEVKKKPRTIQIPAWMDAAISELAAKDKRSVNGEIEFLVESAMQYYTGRVKISDVGQILPETGTVVDISQV